MPNYLQDKAKKRKKDANRTKFNNPFGHGSKKITSLKRFYTSLEFETRKNINLVSISLNGLTIEDFKPHHNKKIFPHEQQVFTYNTSSTKLIIDHFKKALIFAVEEYEADIICINELGMPLNPNGDVSQEAIKFATKLANDNKILIIAGSIHCRKSYLNEGFIFFPGETQSGEKYKTFYKNVSAVQVQEKIFTPSERRIPYTKAFGLGISTMICLELVDYSSAARIAQKNDQIDLLLVPTYLENYGVLEKVAKNLSLPVGAVLLNNCYHNPDIPTNSLYIDGKTYNNGRKEHIIDNKSQIVLRTINVESFTRMKTENSIKFSNEYSALYGLEPITTR